MDFKFSQEDEAFRAQVREFLAKKLTPDMRDAARRTTTVFADKDVAMRWQAILLRKGLGGAVVARRARRHGLDADAEVHLWRRVCEGRRARSDSAWPAHAGACVVPLRHTPSRKRITCRGCCRASTTGVRAIPNRDRVRICRVSRRAAIKDGDDYVVNGTKIWTTHAQFADHIFCLVRTTITGKPQAGITFLLIEMKTPGITVKPIITLAGDHEVNQVFFDNVRVPQANRVGPENEGWTVAKYLLEFERGGGGASARLKIGLGELRSIARKRPADGGAALADDPTFAARMDQLEIRMMALEFAEMTTLARLARGGSPGPESSLQKNTSVDIGHNARNAAARSDRLLRSAARQSAFR